MNTKDVILTRRSTRKFRPDPVPASLVEEVVEAGRFAPSGGNSQSTHFIVIKNKEILDRLAEAVKEEFAKMELTPGLYKSLVNSIRASKTGKYVFHYNAPVLIVTANHKDYGNNLADCSCALMNMMLMEGDRLMESLPEMPLTTLTISLFTLSSMAQRNRALL